MPFAQADEGTRIAYESHGTGNLKVFLLHGWGGSSSYWRDLVSHLNLEGLHLVAPSYRGHGDSEKPSAGYTLDQFAKDVLAVADAEGARQFVLVGFSMSGKFAQYIAAVHPERVLGLCSSPRFQPANSRFLLRRRRHGAILSMIGTPPLARSSHPSPRLP